MNESLKQKLLRIKDSIGVELKGMPGHIAVVLYALFCPFWVISLVALPYCLISQTNPADIGSLFGLYNGNTFNLLVPIWLSFLLYFVLIGKTIRHRFIRLYNSYFLPPLIALSFFAFIFAAGGVYPFGEKTIAWCDYTQQGVPYLANFKSILEGNDSILLNMSNAGGMNAWSLLRSLFIYPFNYLVLFIDYGEIMQFSTILTTLKLALCSVTAMVFFKTCCKKLDTCFAVPLSLMYTFCAYGGMYYQIVTWPDTMYVLPLVLTGIYLLINKGSILLYAISLSLFVSNISHAFMLVLTVIIFMGVYTFSQKGTDTSKKLCFNFASGTIFAVLLSAPFWVSFFGDFGDSARGVDVQTTLQNSSFLTSRYTVYPLLLSTVFIFVALFWHLSRKKTAIQKSYLITFCLMLIPMVVEPINKMWHAGSYMAFPARFAYILTFIGLILCGYALSNDEDETILQVEANKSAKYTIMALSSVVLIVLTGYFINFIGAYAIKYIKQMSTYAYTLWGKEDSFKHIFKLALITLGMYGAVFAAYKKRFLGKKVMALILTALVLSEAFVSVNIYMISASSKVNTDNYELYADLGGKIDDDDFFRVKNETHLYSAYTISEANFPGAIGYNSTGHYSSLANEDYLYAIKALGYSSMWMKIETYGGTELSDALLSIKYKFNKITGDEAVYANEKYGIYETPYYLPLGVVCYTSDFELDIESMERSEMQQKIFETITGSDEKLIVEYEPSSLSGANYTVNDEGNHIIKGKDGKLTYTIEVVGNQTLYLDCFDEYSNSLSEAVNGSFSVSVTVNGVSVKSTTSYPSSDYNKTNGFFKLGEFSDEEVTVTLTVKKDVDCRSFGVFGLDTDVLEKGINNAEGAYLNFNGSEVNGSFTAKQDGWMFVSIPYGTNLVYEVNGKEVKAEKAFCGFTAIPVTAGENTVEIYARSGLLTYAFILTAIAIVVAAALIVIFIKKKIPLTLGFSEKVDVLFEEKSKGAKAFVSNLTWIGIIVAFVVVIIFIYIYPLCAILGAQV